MKATKFVAVAKNLISFAIPFLITYLLFNFVIFQNIIKVGDNTCCGLVPGSVVRYKEFNPLTLKHGDIIFDKEKDSQKITFARVIAFPGEYSFGDLHTGKWGYAKLDAPPKVEMSEGEISELFSAITWLDSPTLQETIPSENLYDRLRLHSPISEDVGRYRVASEVFKEFGTANNVDPADIYGVYDSVFVSNIYYYYILVIIIALLFVVTYDFFSRIFIKIKKSKHTDICPVEHEEKS